MTQRVLPFNRGPDPERLHMVGFCRFCGRVLEPTDYLHCAPCYPEEKHTARRYSREAAQRQLEGVLQRIKQVAANPRSPFCSAA